jgi:hypothetical protein
MRKEISTFYKRKSSTFSVSVAFSFPEIVYLEVLVERFPRLATLVEEGGEVPAHFHQSRDVTRLQVANFRQRINTLRMRVMLLNTVLVMTFL